ncbi:hypothetical protein C7447_103497 [Tenacibaculum adriaticum]|uniref:Uncharacterized protein n=1 Tax=Tenacibaculum adriaticum TaxID=413713 RepID=A0A5S5DRL5_9FLAO|nr:hypothetical protein C7447_103497 [Tenacibaculum adriaticum]
MIPVIVVAAKNSNIVTVKTISILFPLFPTTQVSGYKKIGL